MNRVGCEDNSRAQLRKSWHPFLNHNLKARTRESERGTKARDPSTDYAN
jgi:hypothetical protein